MSDKKENKVSKAVYENKFNKYGITKKTVYSISGMLICIFLIIILSITQARFDTDLINTIGFWVDFAILTGLCIYGMISGQQTGDDVARNNPNGLFRTSLAKYAVSFNKVDALMLFAYFDEWLEFFRERKIRKKTEAFLKDYGIHQMEVLDLDMIEVENLKTPYKKEWRDGKKETYFLSYTPEQIEVIKYCLAGNIKVSRLPRNFFVDAFYQSEKDMWESAANSGKKKSAFLGLNYTYRILTLLALSILSAGLVPGMNEDAGAAEIWLGLAKRIFCVTTAFLWGIFIGFEMVKIDVAYIDFKRDVLNQYHQEYELKVYVPETLEERAKELYEKQQAKNEEYQEVDNNDTEQEGVLD